MNLAYCSGFYRMLIEQKEWLFKADVVGMQYSVEDQLAAWVEV